MICRWSENFSHGHLVHEAECVLFCFLLFVFSPPRVRFSSMRQLRDRVFKLREDADNIYHLVRTEGTPTINWGNMMEEKLVWNRLCLSLARWSF